MKDHLDWRSVRGLSRPFYVPAGESPEAAATGPFCTNLVMYDWATIVAQLLRNNPDGKPHHISAMLLEFENNGGAEVDPPSYTRADAATYYDSLGTHPDRDILRVPLTASSLESTERNFFPGGNLINFFAQTEGVVGRHGKEFSSAEQSRVFGAALIATPDFDDPTQDLVFSRIYYSDPDQQLIKTAGSQIGLQWRLQFE
jgi:hypothetical protein